MKRLLILGLLLVVAACRVDVYDGLSQRDANEMTALLLNAGVDAKREAVKDGTFKVTVDEDQFAAAVTLINRSGLPKPKFASITDVLSDDRLIASPSEERARLNFALAQGLSQTVSEIEGVVTARVHLATPSGDPLSRKDGKSSASVAIHHKRGFDTNGIVPRIKTLIANAVDGLDYERVSIALFPTSQAVSTWTERGLDVENEFADPTPRAPRVVAADPSLRDRITPAVAAVLAGGLVVLLLAGQSLLGGLRGRKTTPQPNPTPAPNRAEERAAARRDRSR